MTLQKEKELFEKIFVEVKAIEDQLSEAQLNVPQLFDDWLIFESTCILSQQAQLDDVKLIKLESATNYLDKAIGEFNKHDLDFIEPSRLNALINQTIELLKTRIDAVEVRSFQQFYH